MDKFGNGIWIETQSSLLFSIDIVKNQLSQKLKMVEAQECFYTQPPHIRTDRLEVRKLHKPSLSYAEI